METLLDLEARGPFSMKGVKLIVDVSGDGLMHLNSRCTRIRRRQQKTAALTTIKKNACPVCRDWDGSVTIAAGYYGLSMDVCEILRVQRDAAEPPRAPGTDIRANWHLYRRTFTLKLDGVGTVPEWRVEQILSATKWKGDLLEVKTQQRKVLKERLLGGDWSELSREFLKAEDLAQTYELTGKLGKAANKKIQEAIEEARLEYCNSTQWALGALSPIGVYQKERTNNDELAALMDLFKAGELLVLAPPAIMLKLDKYGVIGESIETEKPDQRTLETTDMLLREGGHYESLSEAFKAAKAIEQV